MQRNPLRAGLVRPRDGADALRWGSANVRRPRAGAAAEDVVGMTREPTSRLDAVTQAELCRLLRDLAERDGLAVLLVSHDDALLGAMAARTLQLSPPG